MSGSRDMTAPNWARTVKRLRRWAEDFKRHGCEIVWPDDFEIPPERRIAHTSAPLE